MAIDFSKKFQRTRINFENFRQKLVVRVWGLAKRLDPRTMKEEKKKKGFSRLGNKGR